MQEQPGMLFLDDLLSLQNVIYGKKSSFFLYVYSVLPSLKFAKLFMSCFIGYTFYIKLPLLTMYMQVRKKIVDEHTKIRIR